MAASMTMSVAASMLSNPALLESGTSAVTARGGCLTAGADDACMAPLGKGGPNAWGITGKPGQSGQLPPACAHFLAANKAMTI